MFELHYKILHKLSLAMIFGGRYKKAAILISLTPPPKRREAVGAAEQTGLSSALFFAWVTHADKFLCLNLRMDLSRAGLEPATHWLKASCSTD